WDCATGSPKDRSSRPYFGGKEHRSQAGGHYFGKASVGILVWVRHVPPFAGLFEIFCRPANEGVDQTHGFETLALTDRQHLIVQLETRRIVRPLDERERRQEYARAVFRGQHSEPFERATDDEIERIASVERDEEAAHGSIRRDLPERGDEEREVAVPDAAVRA